MVEFNATTPFKEQLEVMASTAVFISVHTSNLANAPFLQPGSAVIELIQRNWIWHNLDKSFQVSMKSFDSAYLWCIQNVLYPSCGAAAVYARDALWPGALSGSSLLECIKSKAPLGATCGDPINYRPLRQTSVCEAFMLGHAGTDRGNESHPPLCMACPPP